jgi:hypothetical protein
MMLKCQQSILKKNLEILDEKIRKANEIHLAINELEKSYGFKTEDEIEEEITSTKALQNEVLIMQAEIEKLIKDPDYLDKDQIIQLEKEVKYKVKFFNILHQHQKLHF